MPFLRQEVERLMVSYAAFYGLPWMIRYIWLSIGGLFLALAALGAVLPLLPTTPFLLLATFAFARSSPTLHQKLLDHPVFGQAIRDWNEKGAISRKGKFASVLAMALSLGVSAALGFGAAILAVQAAAMAGVAAFILTRSST